MIGQKIEQGIIIPRTQKLMISWNQPNASTFFNNFTEMKTNESDSIIQKNLGLEPFTITYRQTITGGLTRNIIANPTTWDSGCGESEEDSCGTTQNIFVNSLSLSEGTQFDTINVGSLEFYFQDVADYEINYELDDGQNHPENPVGLNYEDLPIQLKPAAKEAHIFQGWFTDSAFSSSVEEITVLQDYTLWAKFVPDPTLKPAPNLNKGFQIYLIERNKEILIGDHTVNTQKNSFTFNEELEEQLNNQYTLKFEIAEKYYNNNLTIGSKLKIGQKIKLILWNENDNPIYFIITSISPVVGTDNNIYVVECQDYASYVFSRNNVGLTFDSFEDEEFLERKRLPNVFNLGNYLLERGFLQQVEESDSETEELEYIAPLSELDLCGPVYYKNFNDVIFSINSIGDFNLENFSFFVDISNSIEKFETLPLKTFSRESPLIPILTPYFNKISFKHDGNIKELSYFYQGDNQFFPSGYAVLYFSPEVAAGVFNGQPDVINNLISSTDNFSGHVNFTFLNEDIFIEGQPQDNCGLFNNSSFCGSSGVIGVKNNNSIPYNINENDLYALGVWEAEAAVGLLVEIDYFDSNEELITTESLFYETNEVDIYSGQLHFPSNALFFKIRLNDWEDSSTITAYDFNYDSDFDPVIVVKTIIPKITNKESFWKIKWDSSTPLLLKNMNLAVSDSNTYNSLVEISNLTNSLLFFNYNNKEIEIVSKEDDILFNSYVLSPDFNVEQFNFSETGDNIYSVLYVLGGKDEFDITVTLVPHIPIEAISFFRKVIKDEDFLNQNISIGEKFYFNLWKNGFGNFSWSAGLQPGTERYIVNEEFAKKADNIPYLDSFILNLEYFRNYNLISSLDFNTIFNKIYNDLRIVNIKLLDFFQTKSLLERQIFNYEQQLKINSELVIDGVSDLEEYRNRLNQVFYIENSSNIFSGAFNTRFLEFDGLDFSPKVSILYSVDKYATFTQPYRKNLDLTFEANRKDLEFDIFKKFRKDDWHYFVARVMGNRGIATLRVIPSNSYTLKVFGTFDNDSINVVFLDDNYNTIDSFTETLNGTDPLVEVDILTEAWKNVRNLRVEFEWIEIDKITLLDNSISSSFTNRNTHIRNSIASNITDDFNHRFQTLLTTTSQFSINLSPISNSQELYDEIKNQDLDISSSNENVRRFERDWIPVTIEEEDFHTTLPGDRKFELERGQKPEFTGNEPIRITWGPSGPLGVVAFFRIGDFNDGSLDPFLLYKDIEFNTNTGERQSIIWKRDGLFENLSVDSPAIEIRNYTIYKEGDGYFYNPNVPTRLSRMKGFVLVGTYQSSTGGISVSYMWNNFSLLSEHYPEQSFEQIQPLIFGDGSANFEENYRNAVNLMLNSDFSITSKLLTSDTANIRFLIMRFRPEGKPRSYCVLAWFGIGFIPRMEKYKWVGSTELSSFYIPKDYEIVEPAELQIEETQGVTTHFTLNYPVAQRDVQINFPFFEALRTYRGYNFIEEKLNNIKKEIMSFIKEKENTIEEILSLEFELTEATEATEEEKISINQNISYLQTYLDDIQVKIGNIELDLNEDLILSREIGTLGLQYQRFKHYLEEKEYELETGYRNYLEEVLDIDLNNENPIFQKYLNIQDEKRKIWFDLKKDYGEFLLEGYYENEIETDPEKLYREGLLFANGVKEPLQDYNLSYLDISNLTERDIKDLKAGDVIKIRHKNFNLSEKEINVQIQNITKELRNQGNITLGIDRLEYQQKLVEKLLKKLNE